MFVCFQIEGVIKIQKCNILIKSTDNYESGFTQSLISENYNMWVLAPLNSK